jgi:hypothetical protein
VPPTEEATCASGPINLGFSSLAEAGNDFHHGSAVQSGKLLMLFMGSLSRLLPKDTILGAIALNACFEIGRNAAYCREYLWAVRVEEVEQEVDAKVNYN